MSLKRKSLSLASSIDSLASVEQLIDELHEDGAIQDEVYGNILVATTEAFLNAIQHGNKGDVNKLTTVNVSIGPAQLEITVEDEGNGYAYESLPDPTDPENLEKVNGRGLFIIKNLADDVSFERNGATLNMRFNLSVKELIEA